MTTKRVTIKLKDGMYQSFCKDKDFIVFAKMTKRRDGWTSLNFNKTVTFSNEPGMRDAYKQHIYHGRK